MDKIKKYILYIALIALFALFSNFLIAVGLNSNYKEIERRQDNLSQVEVVQAEATKVNYGAFRNSERNLSGKLYLLINYPTSFKVFRKSDLLEELNEDITFSDIDFFSWIRFDDDIFLKINNVIDKILDDNKEREEFHEKLNQELKALNKSL